MLEKAVGIKIILFVILLSAFGPYIMMSPGIRVEHIVIYTFFVLSVVYSLLEWRGLRVNKSLFVIFVCYSLSFLWMTLRFLFSERTSAGSIAAFENIFQPVALLYIGLILASSRLPIKDRKSVFRFCAQVIIFMLFMNSLFILVGFFADTWQISQYFTGEFNLTKDESIVWYKAAEKGRLIGIFNQPFESGLAYSIALLCWIYMHLTYGKSSIVWWVFAAGVLWGGWVSGSKVFLFLGLGFSVMFWFLLNRAKMGKLNVNSKSGVFALIALVAFSASMIFYSKLGPVASLFKNNYFFEEPFLKVISGARMGKIEMTDLESYFLNVWESNYLVGIGFPANHALDSEFLQLFSYGGLVGIFFYLVLISSLIYYSCIGITKKHPEGAMLFFMVGLMVTAAFGAPVLTINRVSIIIWILVFTSITITSAKDVDKQ